jgi:hypothetical protein
MNYSARFIFFGLSIFGLTTLLLGCGGGGGGSSGPSAEAEGVYEGTTSTGKFVNALILEDSSFWDIYGVMSGTIFQVQGVMNGTSDSRSGLFSAAAYDFPEPGNSVINARLNGNYVVGSSLNGTLTENAVNATFTLVVPVQSTYDYNTAANIASISGTWSGGLLNGETATIDIAGNGVFSGTSSLGCTFFGTTTPRPSGKNVFNVSLTFGGAPCVATNQTVHGIGLTYPIGNGQDQLIVGLSNTSHTLATAFFAQR